MIFFAHIRNDEEEMETEDTDAGLDDSTIDEMTDDDNDDDTEGFGHIDEDGNDKDEEEDVYGRFGREFC